MQPFQVFGLRGVFDVCYFYQDYKNFIEFSMGPWGNHPTNPIKRIGYKFLNIGPAKVTGIDISFNGEGKINKNIEYRFMTSYTWSNPVTKNKNYTYYEDIGVLESGDTLVKEYSFANTSSDAKRSVLKYRIEHMVKLDLEFTFFKKMALGGTFNYYSAMKNVDLFMFENDILNPNSGSKVLIKSYGDVPFYGFYNFFQKNKKGSVTLDLRASYYFDKVSLSFIVKNVTNRLYALRPLYAEPTRTYTLQLIVKI